MRLLIADDEKEMTNSLKKFFIHRNFTVDVVYNGADALAGMKSGLYDGIILDIMLPDIDGVTVLKTARAQGVDTPVLFLSAKGDVDDRVYGLEAGADDYLTKPFALKEVEARVRAMTRRNTVLLGDYLNFNGLVLNRDLSRIEYDGKVEHLPQKEFLMLELLMRNTHTLIASEQFVEKIWGLESGAEVNIVCVYISYLRRKLNKIKAPCEIKSNRGIGYQLIEKVQK